MFCESFNISSHAVIYPHDIKAQSDLLPKALKRRMSQVSKMAFIASKLCAKDAKVDHIIFASQHGELDHTFSLLEQISQQEILSPMKFSQSVHNSASGLFCIDQQSTAPANSIAAGEDTFFMAFIDAVAYLNENPSKQLLLTIFDQAIIDAYQALNISHDHAIALSLLLSKSNRLKSTTQSMHLSITNHNHSHHDETPEHPVEQFVQFMQSNTTQFTQQSLQYMLNWTKT